MPESFKNQPITWSMFVAIIIFVLGAAGWAQLNFISRAEAEENNRTLLEKVDLLGTQVNVAAAFQMERGFQADLDKLNDRKTDPPSDDWIKALRKTAARRDLAAQYKSCLLKPTVDNDKKNCEFLQKQLWR